MPVYTHKTNKIYLDNLQIKIKLLINGKRENTIYLESKPIKGRNRPIRNIVN